MFTTSSVSRPASTCQTERSTSESQSDQNTITVKVNGEGFGTQAGIQTEMSALLNIVLQEFHSEKKERAFSFLINNKKQRRRNPEQEVAPSKDTFAKSGCVQMLLASPFCDPRSVFSAAFFGCTPTHSACNLYHFVD